MRIEIVIGIFILLCLIYILVVKDCEGKEYRFMKEKEQIIKTLIRQGARWSTAAEQDKVPMVAVLHANYGAGYLWALKDIMSQKDIEKIADIDLMKYERTVLEIQDKATKNMANLCPQYAPPETYLTKLGGEL